MAAKTISTVYEINSDEKALIKKILGSDCDNAGSISCGDGSVYFGGLTAGKPSGFGVKSWNDGTRFEGEWQNGVKHGKGKFMRADGGSFEGEWEDDVNVTPKEDAPPENSAPAQPEPKRETPGTDKAAPHNTEAAAPAAAATASAVAAAASTEGHTTVSSLSDSEGEYYGEIKNGLPNGKGRKKYTAGGMYDGEWLDGRRHGYGVMIYPNNTVYEGRWANDKRNGMGKFTRADNSCFEVEWINDTISAQSAAAIAPMPAPPPVQAAVPAPEQTRASTTLSAFGGELEGATATTEFFMMKGKVYPVFAYSDGGFYAGTVDSGKRGSGFDFHKDSVGKYVASEYKDGVETDYYRVRRKSKITLVLLTMFFGALGYLLYLKSKLFALWTFIYSLLLVLFFGFLAAGVSGGGTEGPLGFVTVVLLITNLVYFIKALTKPVNIVFLKRQMLPKKLAQYLT